MIVEAEKSHTLPSTIWKTKKAGSIIQSKSKGLRIRGTNGLGQPESRSENQDCQCPGTKERDVPADAESTLALRPPLCSVKDLSGAPALAKVIFFTQSAFSNADLFQKHPHRHTQKCLISNLGT